MASRRAQGRRRRNQLQSAESQFGRATAAAGLRDHFRVGLGAVASRYHKCLHVDDPRRLTGSIDMDTAHSGAEPQANRWDYGIGIDSNSRSGEIAVWIEPHSAASTREVEVVLAKLAWLRDKLAKYHKLRQLTQAAESLGAQPFVWLASDGEISIVRTSRQFRALAQAGLGMPTRQLRLP